jgi:hypothetical protein
MDLCEGVLSMHEMIQMQIKGKAGELNNDDICLPPACHLLYGGYKMDMCKGVLSMREMMQRNANRRESRELLMMTLLNGLLVIYFMVDRMVLCEGVLSMREMMQAQKEGKADELFMMTFAYRLLVFILRWIGWTCAKVF